MLVSQLLTQLAHQPLSLDSSSNNPPPKHCCIERVEVTFIHHDRWPNTSKSNYQLDLVGEILYHYPSNIHPTMPSSFIDKSGECVSFAIVALLGDHFNLDMTTQSTSSEETNTNSSASTKVMVQDQLSSLQVIDMESSALQSAMDHVPQVHFHALKSTFFKNLTHCTVLDMFSHNQNVGDLLQKYKDQIMKASAFSIGLHLKKKFVLQMVRVCQLQMMRIATLKNAFHLNLFTSSTCLSRETFNNLSR
jgi:hypothetical protein